MSYQQNIINLFPSLAHWFSCVQFACGLKCHEARGSNGFFNGKAQELVTFWLVCLKLKTLAKKTQVHSHMTSNTHTHTHKQKNPQMELGVTSAKNNIWRFHWHSPCQPHMSSFLSNRNNFILWKCVQWTP